MEDSLEDFIRLSKNTKNLADTNPARTEILVTAHIKKECDTKAMQLIEFAIDGKLRAETLFKCLPHINQTHYQDIVEERAISKLCGYPLCGKKIPDMPKKHYHISVRSNKVYDITDRKNYCSNYCYKASLHIKKQIDDGPLWLRKHDGLCSFSLLSKNDRGLPGELVDQGVARPVLEPSFTPVSAFTEMSLDEMEENEVSPDEPKCRKKKFTNRAKLTMNSISEDEEDEIEADQANCSENLDTIREDKEVNESHNNQNIAQKLAVEVEVQKIKELIKEKNTARRIVKLETAEVDKNKEKREVRVVSNTADGDIESYLLKCFKDWIHIETLFFLHGEKKVKEVLNDQKLIDYFDSLQIKEQQFEQQKKYMEICRKLHLKELADEKFDKTVVGAGSALKPLPDYKQLKEESKHLDLQVRAFYSGVLKMEDVKENHKKDEQSSDNNTPAVLPLTDASSQKALRRKIYLNSFNKSLRTVLQNLRIETSFVLDDVQALIKTFELRADNIVFKPATWDYVVLAVLKILSLKDKALHNLMEEPGSKEYVSLCLDTLPQKGAFIDEILESVRDIDTFVKLYINAKE